MNASAAAVPVTAPALATHALNKRFGGIVATRDVSLRLEQGARHALIGPNGAGKTTLINQLTGVLAPSSGSIELGGEDITRLAQHKRVRRGLVRTFQINQLFLHLTPLQSVCLAASQARGASGGWRRLGADKTSLEQSADLLLRFGLADVMQETTARLAYGKRRLLEVAVALACRPRVLLLDEPLAGVPEGERDDIMATLAALPAEVSVLLIEHDMDLVFSFATRISVLADGALLAEGSPSEIAADAQVRAVYLGETPPGGAR
jgi:ABC-type branched-subunit amino acid transport system ATPase component